MPHITSRLDFRNIKHLVSVLSWRILHFVDNSERVGRQKYRTKPLRFGDFIRLEVSVIGMSSRRGLALQPMWQCHRGRSGKLLWGPVWWSMGAALSPLPPALRGLVHIFRLTNFVVVVVNNLHSRGSSPDVYYFE